ncbi:MAG: hypothetical protein AB7O57_02230 [Hyphomicrobiaceae bacterium]
MPATFVRRIAKPHADALLRRLAAEIDDDMLKEIASADDGANLEGHLAGP